MSVLGDMWTFAGAAFAVGLLAAFPSPLAAQEGPGGEFFEKKIRPLLARECYSCHSVRAGKTKGGLRLDARETLLKGGTSGPAIVPGDPDRSLLVRAVRYADESLQMPPKKRLTPEEVGHLEAWVRAGASDPRREGEPASPSTAAGAPKFWSLRPVDRPPLPPVRLREWPKSPVDAFILSKLEEKGLRPAPPADKRALLRRATYGLTGLPPSPQEMEAFAADGSSDAFEKAVDRLLDSPRYGERWARHWLDLARYSDTKGGFFNSNMHEDPRFVSSYTYRDWVIRALNEDMPYDRFILLQVAADRLPDGRNDLAALGFLTLGLRHYNDVNAAIDDRIEVVMRGLQGLTVGCARCHDHKFDPIPTRDYYSLHGIFSSSRVPSMPPLVDETAPKSEANLAFERELRAAEDEVAREVEAQRQEIAARFRTPEAIREQLLAAKEVSELPSAERERAARRRGFELVTVQRWVDYLKARKESPIFAAWHAFAALPPAAFAERSPAVVAEISARANPLLAETIAEPPGSLAEAADRYAALLSRFDGEAARPDPHEEALRQVLRAPDAPPSVPANVAENLVERPKYLKLIGLRRKVNALHVDHPGAPPRAMAMEDGSPHNSRVLIGGDPKTPGEPVPRQFLEALAGAGRQPFTKGSGRLELAQAIATSGNPLIARVLVNRAWHHHFGEGLVRTLGDFGAQGELPTHPELLDYLAREFMDSGWSLKALHRRILLSNAYRQSARDAADGRRVDPENRLLWRMSPRRLDFEAMRDSLLAVSGGLDPAMGGRGVELTAAPFARRRAVYGYVDRADLPEIFTVFDFPRPDAHSPQRGSTTVPQQALFLMNNPFVLEQAQGLATRVAGETAPERRLQALVRLAYGRIAKPDEVFDGLSFLVRASESPGPLTPWERLAHALLQSTEFVFVD